MAYEAASAAGLIEKPSRLNAIYGAIVLHILIWNQLVALAAPSEPSVLVKSLIPLGCELDHFRYLSETRWFGHLSIAVVRVPENETRSGQNFDGLLAPSGCKNTTG